MKICTNCLTLHEHGDACPSCGSGLVPLALWQGINKGPPARKDAPAANEGESAVSPGGGLDGTKFVLGVFLSSLCFFIGFLLAYVVLGLK